MDASGKTKRDPNKVRGREVDKVLRRRIRQDLVIMASLLIGITTVGWVRSNNISTDIRDASVDGCERQNEVRRQIRIGYDEDIHDARHPDPQILKEFHIAPKNLQELIDKQIHQLKHRKRDIPNAPCDDLYPQT